jgi:hypothetical protein
MERSIDIFLTRSFDDLITDTYLPKAILEQKRTFSSGYMEEQSKTTPTTTDNNISSSSVNNTSAYK